MEIFEKQVPTIKIILLLYNSSEKKDIVSSHQIKDQVVNFFCHYYPGNFRKTGKYHRNLVIIHEKKIWLRPTVAKTQPNK
jgi:hypothetical protein